ncbi:winged helix-turn-helix domain-containing protein [Sphingomonas arenae]|uniref:winged helix-turn-helix domain-containing protein n=1 Tax=Sphingomonas arenae TaxID=2812555 RepID=UPI0019675C22|nr:transcriptional regulator [Sphingomonas arenae]
MQPVRFRFADFLLAPGERRLSRDGEVVEINGRYFDALELLVRERGRLVTKDRFMEEVWRGVPVTDEALTQCIRTLRRQLGDEAGRPRFIETVPKHGYRFIAHVEDGSAGPVARSGVGGGTVWWTDLLRDGLAGTGGGVAAGLLGGLVIGFVSASEGPIGAASALLVLLCVTVLVALLGGAGVAFGIAAARALRERFDGWSVVGGAAGGLLVGAAVKLLGSDAFMLLVGRSPGDVTGAAEGAVLGAALGLGCWIGRKLTLRQAMALAAGLGASAGLLISVTGGRLLIGSLDQLAGSFPESRLRIDNLGALMGEGGLGPVSLAITAALEGALFGALLVGALLAAGRHGRA